ncbi:MAG: hypothetical protein J5644_10815 [Bacteroidales bacterium]|nr:hypothetical protein [Bacteroidales bacterium]
MSEKEDFQPEKPETGEPHGMAYLLRLMLRMRYWILACCAVLALGVFIALRFVPKQYDRTIVLKVDMSAYDGVSDSLPDAEGKKVEFVRDRMESKVMLLQSQPVVNQAMKMLVAQNGNTHAETVVLYSRNKSNLSAQYSRYSDVIRLTFRSPNPQQADAFLLCLVESYNETVARDDTYDHAYITVIDPPQGSDKQVYPHTKALYLLAFALGVLAPLTWVELKDWWKTAKFS